jgi:hypothetical protein
MWQMVMACAFSGRESFVAAKSRAGVIEQFSPGEREAQFEAEWSKQRGGWKFGKRVSDA